MKWLKLAVIFFCVAFLISFALIPLYNVYFGDATTAQWAGQVISELRLQSNNYWKSFFTFYLGLWCGKAILWALATAPSKPEKSR